MAAKGGEQSQPRLPASPLHAPSPRGRWDEHWKGRHAMGAMSLSGMRLPTVQPAARVARGCFCIACRIAT